MKFKFIRAISRTTLLSVTLVAWAESHAASNLDPASFEFIYEGRTLFDATPLPGNCPIDGGGSFESEMGHALFTLAEFSGPIVGASTDCAWLADIEDGTRQPDPYPVIYGVSPLERQEGRPWFPEQERTVFLDIFSAIAAPWFERRLGESARDLEMPGVPAPGVVDRDDAGLYVAQLRSYSDGGQHLVLAVATAVTLVDGLAVEAKAFTFIDDSEDLEPLIVAAKHYVRHLIDLNERPQ